MKRKISDTVGESRKRKEAVALETQGMTRAEVLTYFNRDAVRHRFQQAAERARQK